MSALENLQFIDPDPGGLQQQLHKLITPIVEDLGFSIVRIRYTPGSRRGKTSRPAVLQIMAERPDGSLKIDDCQRISRALSPALDAQDPIASEYQLEVSSPGIDRPLTRVWDFTRWAGFETKITTREMIDGRRRVIGTLKGSEEGAALIETNQGQIFSIPYPQIASAQLILTDALITYHKNMVTPVAETTN